MLALSLRRVGEPIRGVCIRQGVGCRFVSDGKIQSLNEELQEFMHGRGFRERRDSVTNQILLERQNHMERIQRLPVDNQLSQSLDRMGLGEKRRKNLVYAPVKSLMFGGGAAGLEGHRKTNTGAGGFAVHLTSAIKDWPVFKHMLPEIAFAGHSNSGKSTLVNAMIGVLPSKGPAKVSDRAGWTDQICFYQLGKRPPVLTLVDMPGYGHAVASAAQRRAWGNMTRDYLQNRAVLSRCCILVDCTRGLCRQDKMLVRYLTKRGIPWMVVLTKGDLLDCDTLAQCVMAVQLDLAAYVDGGGARADGVSTDIGGTSAAARRGAVQESAGRDESRTSGRSNSADGSGDGSSTPDQTQNAAELRDSVANEEPGDEGQLSARDRVMGDEIGSEEEDEGLDISEGEEDDGPDGMNAVTGSSSGKAEAGGDSYIPEDVDVPNRRRVPVHVISASTGAGIQQLWRRLCDYARADAPIPPNMLNAPPATVVREHRLASLTRGQRLLTRSDAISVANKAKLSPALRNQLVAASARPPPVRLGKNRRSVRERVRESKDED